MKLKIAVLPGDGIGPEICQQGVNVVKAIASRFGHEISFEYAICGADAIDKVLSSTDKPKAFKNFITAFEAIVAYHMAAEKK